MVPHRHHRIGLRDLQVRRVVDVTPWLRRVTLAGEQLGAFERDGHAVDPFVSDAPDDHVKIFLPASSGQPVVLPRQADGHLSWPSDPKPTSRDYTVRRFDASAGELDLDFVLHDHGVASDWVRSVEPGDVVHVAGPRQSHLYPDASTVWLLGDRTAFPAIARWVEELSPGVTAIVVIEGGDGLDDLAAPDGVSLDLRIVDAAPDALAAAVRSFPDPGADTFAFAAGELDSVRRVRVAFRDRGVPPDRTQAASYWRRGDDDPETADVTAGLRLVQQTDLLTPNAIRVAATLGLADLIDDGVTDVATLAERTATDPAILGSLCAHLVREEVFTVDPDDRLGLGATGRLLLDGHPFDARERLRNDGAEGHFAQAWSGLLHAARTGTPGFDRVYGRPFWDEIREDPVFATSFDAYLDAWCAEWAPSVSDVLDWSGDGHLLDIGGGTGRLLSELLARAPRASGTLVELPEAVVAARARFVADGLADRATAVAGDMFEVLPSADVALLAQVIHDWPDADAVRLLRRAAAAVGPDGQVAIIERRMDDAVGVRSSYMTLLMQNLFAATERTEAEYAALAAAAGLRLDGTKPVLHDLVLMRLVPDA